MRNDIFLSWLPLMAAMMMLSGCSDASSDLGKERDDRDYRAAMTDYHAGRMDAALDGFTKAARNNPANASVRFQLACLLQDYKKDYLGAYCAFREYLLQHPESDKASIASARLSDCEKSIATALATKYGIDGADKANTIEVLRKDLKESERRLAAAEKELQSLRERHVTLSEERDRMVAAIKSTDEVDPKETAPRTDFSVKEAQKLLEEDEPKEEIDRNIMSKDIASLKADEKEEMQGSSLILPKQAADAKAKRDKLKADQERAKQDAAERERNRHPPEYIVQEGDTLYRLAERFYGKISAWKAIRDANKALISNDGRLKTGIRIVLPYGVK